MIMEDEILIHPIAYMHSDFREKFGIPRQSGLVEALNSTIVFCEPYNHPDYMKGLEGFSHLWLIWGFSKNGSSQKATVRPPRLGGDERLGVWATRSPFRPNPLGLSCVSIREIRETKKGMEIDVSGADLMDGTPIYDIKPYVPLADLKEDATGGFTHEREWERLEVFFENNLIECIPKEKREALIGVLSEDPRPAYHDDENRLYGMYFAGYNIGFYVKNKKIVVVSIERLA